MGPSQGLHGLLWCQKCTVRAHVVGKVSLNRLRSIWKAANRLRFLTKKHVSYVKGQQNDIFLCFVTKHFWKFTMSFFTGISCDNKTPQGSHARCYVTQCAHFKTPLLFISLSTLRHQKFIVQCKCLEILWHFQWSYFPRSGWLSHGYRETFPWG